jgi:hypothetical protein
MVLYSRSELKASGLGGINSDISDMLAERSVGDDFDLDSVLKALEEDDDAPVTRSSAATAAKTAPLPLKPSNVKQVATSSDVTLRFLIVIHSFIHDA